MLLSLSLSHTYTNKPNPNSEECNFEKNKYNL